MIDNLKIWNTVKAPPSTAMKEIKGGRLNGYTDISPQWRLQALTEQFGPAGFGWTYEIIDKWTEPGPNDQVAAFVNVLLFVYMEGEWSRGIPGTGGSMLIAQEKSGPHFSDEAFKMATTDAISVAAKCLGVGSDVYIGQLSHKDSKYQTHKPPESPPVDRMPSQKRLATNENIKAALVELFDDDKEAMKNKLIELTTWEKDGKTITGKANYEGYSDKQAEVVAKELGRLIDAKNSEVY